MLIDRTQLPEAQRFERLEKSFDDVIQEWSRSQLNGDQVFDEIAKAVSTGLLGSGGFPAQTGGQGAANALRLENLDATMTSVLFREEHLKLFNWLPKVPSQNAYYEWNRRSRYGSSRGFAGFGEGGAPQGTLGEWRRNGTYVKYLGTRGGVTHQVALAGQLGGMQVDPVSEENHRATMDLLERIERASLWGGEAILDKTGKAANYDGIFRQLVAKRPANVIDLRGRHLTLDDLGNVAFRLYQEGKVSNYRDVRQFMSGSTLEDVSKLRYSTIIADNGMVVRDVSADRRNMQGGPNTPAYVGGPIAGFTSNFGVIPFEPSIFMEEVEGGVPLSLVPGNPGADANAPARVNAGTALTIRGSATLNTEGVNPEAATGMPTNFTAATATYYYAVAAVNDAGEALPNTTSAAVTVTTGQAVRLRIPRVTGSGLSQARAYRIYRGTRADGTDLQFVGTQPDHGADGNGTCVDFVDKNGSADSLGIMAGTQQSFVLHRGTADLCIAQMSPLIKWPLPVFETTAEFLLLLYHTIVLKAEERQFMFKNIGRLN
jgi:hypothetical protein